MVDPDPGLAAPLVVDTDIGGDPDDAIALAVAARRVAGLRLVITADEHGGDRARFARHLLDLAGRADVAVITGPDLGSRRYYCADGLVPDTVPGQPDGVAAAVEEVLRATGGPVRWAGIGPMTSLAGVLAAHPEYAGRLRVTQMGGALAYRDPARAEHNVRLDPGSAVRVLTAGLPHLTLVPSDVTFTTATEITAASPIARSLADPGAPAWAGLLTRHMRQWFGRFHPGTMQHDALALAVALGHPSVSFARASVAIAPDGRMTEAASGVPLTLASRVRYDLFMRWLARQLDWAGDPAGGPAAGVPGD